jgi:hypothetical protein
VRHWICLDGDASEVRGAVALQAWV